MVIAVKYPISTKISYQIEPYGTNAFAIWFSSIVNMAIYLMVSRFRGFCCAVNSIGESAFGTCLKVNEIHIAATVPPTACSNSFSPAICPSAIIYVPVGSKEAYASADVWKGFSNIREESTSGISEAISVPFKANVEQGSLTISNADGMQVQVYTLDGRMIYSTDSYTGEHISISGGPHIIKVEDSTITVL